MVVVVSSTVVVVEVSSGSGKEVTVALPSGILILAAILSASSRFALPEKTCNWFPEMEGMGFYRIPQKCGKGGKAGLFAENLDKNAFGPFPVKFSVKNAFPGAKIKPSPRDSHDHLAPHEGAFQVGIGVVFRAVMPVLGVGFFRGQLFQPFFKVVMQTGLIIVDEDRGGDVHGVDQAKAFTDAGLTQGGFDLRGDIEKGPAGRGA